MDKTARLISELDRIMWVSDRNERGLRTAEWDALKVKYAAKPAKRIPAVRVVPRVSKKLHPRPDASEAVTIFPDGREVCNQKIKAGRVLYSHRTLIMADRQDGNCADCQRYMRMPTFDHESGRTSGHKDERIWTPEGLPMNAALCGLCNTQRGSRRTPYKFQFNGTREEYESREGKL